MLGIEEQVNGRSDAPALGQNDRDLADSISKLGRKPRGFDIQKSEACIRNIHMRLSYRFIGHGATILKRRDRPLRRNLPCLGYLFLY